jgi:hypothetical protein
MRDTVNRILVLKLYSSGKTIVSVTQRKESQPCRKVSKM